MSRGRVGTIALALWGFAVNAALTKGWLDWCPNWGVAGMLAVPIGIWVVMGLTHDRVRDYLQQTNRIVALATFILIGALLGAAIGGVIYELMRRPKPTALVQPSPASPISPEEGLDEKQTATLLDLREQYIKTVRELAPTELPPTEWINTRLNDLGQHWFFSPKKPRSVYDYFLADSGFSIGSTSESAITPEGPVKLKTEYKTQINFDSRSKVLYAYVPVTRPGITAGVCKSIIHDCEKLADAAMGGVEIITDDPRDLGAVRSKDLLFTRKVYLYYDGLLSLQELGEIEAAARERDVIVQLRGTAYAEGQTLRREASNHQRR